jgi:hypothetical protein
MRCVPKIAATLAVLVQLSCSTSGGLGFDDEGDHRARAPNRSEGGVRVSVSVLSAQESWQLYGDPLALKAIQPVWIKVENNENRAYWLMSPGVDPNFLPASEAAEAFGFGQSGDEERSRRFQALAFKNPVPPKHTVEGFVLTHLDEGVKMVQVDLVTSGHMKSFSFLTKVPGFIADYHARESFTEPTFADHEVQNIEEPESLRRVLEVLPCCVTNKGGSRNGDPLNLVLIGGVEEVFPALVRRGWRPTEVTSIGSINKMITSVLTGERYRYAPVSPLYFYGRPQDLALQKARDNIHQRNHLRLWRSPLRYRGKAVWVGQISRDIGSRLTLHSPYLTTHKIDPDVDEARIAFAEDIAYSQSLRELGFVKGVGAATKSNPRENLTTDPYYTDGLRLVMVFDRAPKSLTEIEFLPWEELTGSYLIPHYAGNTPR